MAGWLGWAGWAGWLAGWLVGWLAGMEYWFRLDCCPIDPFKGLPIGVSLPTNQLSNDVGKQLIDHRIYKSKVHWL